MPSALSPAACSFPWHMTPKVSPSCAHLGALLPLLSPAVPGVPTLNLARAGHRSIRMVNTSMFSLSAETRTSPGNCQHFHFPEPQSQSTTNRCTCRHLVYCLMVEDTGSLRPRHRAGSYLSASLGKYEPSLSQHPRICWCPWLTTHTFIFT